MKTITTFMTRHPWTYVVLAFVVLLAAWSTLITVAMKYSPQTVEVSK
ncbi:MAG TPA: hypothetical protein VFY13_06060 [Luteolibacter sp.]|nr:hypothetical protein [Luteolibacter sp.]